MDGLEATRRIVAQALCMLPALQVLPATCHVGYTRATLRASGRAAAVREGRSGPSR
jgi:hypothetical protein